MAICAPEIAPIPTKIPKGSSGGYGVYCAFISLGREAMCSLFMSRVLFAGVLSILLREYHSYFS